MFLCKPYVLAEGRFAAELNAGVKLLQLTVASYSGFFALSSWCLFFWLANSLQNKQTRNTVSLHHMADNPLSTSVWIPVLPLAFLFLWIYHNMQKKEKKKNIFCWIHWIPARFAFARIVKAPTHKRFHSLAFNVMHALNLLFPGERRNLLIESTFRCQL